MDFDNHVAVVTGGTGALGSTVTLNLLASGCRVAVPYLNSEDWGQLDEQAGSRRGELWGAKVDLTDGDAVRVFTSQVAERWGRMDFLICIAGGFAAGKTHETSEETWDRMFDLNLKSLFLAVRSVAPMMIRQGYGCIITISSGAILRGGGAGMAGAGGAAAFASGAFAAPGAADLVFVRA